MQKFLFLKQKIPIKIYVTRYCANPSPKAATGTAVVCLRLGYTSTATAVQCRESHSTM